MYITLTTKCNMHCAHCCMSATSRGKHMSEKVFAACLEHLEDDGLLGVDVTLGGGEPTLHPHFEDWLWRAIRVFYERCSWAAADNYRIGVVTNGSKTEIACRLAQLAKTGIIHATLSRDRWHDPIDSKVVKAFTKNERERNDENDWRGIQSVDIPINIGRAKRTGVGCESLRPNDCCCPTFTVDVNGGIHPCGCPKAPVLCSILKPDWELINSWSDDVRDGYAHAVWTGKRAKSVPEEAAAM